MQDRGSKGGAHRPSHPERDVQPPYHHRRYSEKSCNYVDLIKQ